MTDEERMAIATRSGELLMENRIEEADAVFKTLPLAPEHAMLWKKYVGVESLKAAGWDLSDAEKRYGKGWLDDPNCTDVFAGRECVTGRKAGKRR
ncbi:MAG: hypothetical protein LBK61_01480 [Spirochaetaceae bacterium]|jgi:hypothetical protein|nr:hypothetical protein [Spirochaetaceae bacterium]